MIALGLNGYFAVGWNRLDFVVVCISVLEIILQMATGRASTGLSVLRTFRLLRVLKLAQFSKTMRLLGATISRSLGALANLTLILTIIIYVFAVMGFQLFAASYVPENFPDQIVPRYNFVDFQHSFMIIFRILCGEWAEPMWDTIVAAGYASVIFYVVALVVANFIVLNLFLALLLSAFDEEGEQEESDERKDGERNEEREALQEKNIVQEPLLKQHRTHSEQANSITDTGYIEVDSGEVQCNGQEGPAESSDIHGKNVGTTGGMFNRLFRCRGVFAWRWRKNKVSPSLTTMQALSTAPSPTSSWEATPVLMSSASLSRPVDSEAPRCEAKASLDTAEPVVGQSGNTQTKKKTKINTANEKFGQHPTGLGKIRRWCYILVTNWLFEDVILVVIVWSSIMLCFEDASLRTKPDLEQLLFQFNVFFCITFVFEMIVKIVALSPKGYFTDGWNLLDFLIVIISVVAVALAGSNIGAVRSLRTLRALRPLRAVSRWESMKITVNSLLNSIPAISNVLLVCMLLWLIFAIMGVQFFGGKFYKCVDAEGRLYPIDVINNKTQCLAMGEPEYTWVNSKITFDNVLHAFMALFQVGTFEGWMEVMADSVDARGIDLQPKYENAFYAYYFYVAFIIVGSFFALNLFIGVIIDNFSKLKTKYANEARGVFMSETQQRYVDMLQNMIRRKPQKHTLPPANRFRRACFNLANKEWLEVAIMIAIGLNMITFMFEHYDMSQTWITLQIAINIVFTIIYTLEAAIKICGWGKVYFHSGWNWFDFTIVTVSWVGIALDFLLVEGGLDFNPSILRVLRVLRVVRVLRLIKFAKGIQSLLLTLVYSAPALLNVASLLFLILFIFAVIGMNLFGNVVYNGAINEFVNFRDFGNSMVLLFRLMTAAGWNDVLDACMVQAPDCDPGWEGVPNGNCGSPVSAQVYFASFVVITFLIMINMYIAIILENLALARERELYKLDSSDFERFYERWAKYDPQATQFIHQRNLLPFLISLQPPLGIPDADLQDLANLNLPIYYPGRFHCLDVIQALTRRVVLVRGSLPYGELTNAEADLVDQTIAGRLVKTFPRKAKAGNPDAYTGDRATHSQAARLIQRAFRNHQDRQRAQHEHSDANIVRRLHRGDTAYFEEKFF